MQQVSLVPILLWVAPLLCAGVAIWREPRPVRRGFVIDRLLRYLFLFPLGVQGLWAFVGHVFFAEQAAASIGWADTPFQYEVGVANLGLGLASIYAAFRGFEARLAVAIAAAGFLIGAGIIHILDIMGKGNLAPGNAGPILVTDFLTPVVILVLLALASGKLRPKSATTLALEAELEVARKAMRDYRDALSELGKR
jgi:Na+/melibiose symporter-like transporter